MNTNIPTTDPPPRTPRRNRRIFSLHDLDNLPAPRWLVDGCIEAGTLVCFYGQSGTYKSFLAQSLALSVASGQPWFGKKVERGPVVYVAAEGFNGIKSRIQAWMTENGQSDADLYVVDRAVSFLEPEDVTDFLDDLKNRDIKPALVIVDTLSKSFVGGDENAQRDMVRFVASASALRDETGASVIVIHHTGKSGGTERGSSVLRADFDAMFAVKPHGSGGTSFSSNKSRDSALPADFRFKVTEVGNSLVVRPFLTDVQAKALTLLANGPNGLLSYREWQRQVDAGNGGFDRIRNLLCSVGLAEKAEGGGYSITCLGLHWLGREANAPCPAPQPSSEPSAGREGHAVPPTAGPPFRGPRRGSALRRRRAALLGTREASA